MAIEIAEAMKSVNLLELSEKTQHAPAALDENEKVVAAELDRAFRKIGETGSDPDHLIATLITRTITEDVINADDSYLDLMFDRGNVGEFDEIEGVTTPKNTLIAYEAAKGGNVPRSWLDVSALHGETRHLQVETDISYADLRKNGWKTVSRLNTYISDTLHNKMYQIMFDKVGNAIVHGAANYIDVSDTMPTQDAMDAMALYMAEHSDGEGVIIGLTKYIQAIGKLKGYQSNEMLNELYQTGFHKHFDGHPLKAINSSKKLGDGSMLISDKVLYGVCGKIGSLDMRGEVRTYEDSDNQNEVMKIKTTGFEFSYMYNNDTLEKVVKMVLQ